MPVNSVVEAPEILVTQRLILRRPGLSDAPAVFEYASDPEVTRYMDWRTHTDVQDTVDFLRRCAPRWASGEELSWLLATRPADVVIGAVGCRVRAQAAEIGFVLNREYWQQGYATEAASAVVAWAFSDDSILRVWATCDAENLASARVLEKIGMTREAILRRYKVRPNLSTVPRDTFVYGMVRTVGHNR